MSLKEGNEVYSSMPVSSLVLICNFLSFPFCLSVIVFLYFFFVTGKFEGERLVVASPFVVS